MVEGQLVPLDVRLVVRELAEAGFSIESPTPFAPGARQHFRFTTAARDEVMLDATAIHCRLSSADASGHVKYITGFEFISSPNTDRAVAVLIDTLSSVLSLE